MKYNFHATISNIVDHVFSLNDQLLLDKDETAELLKQARGCKSVDDVLNLAISDPAEFLVASHPGVEDDFSTLGKFCSKPTTFKKVAVFQ